MIIPFSPQHILFIHLSLQLMLQNIYGNIKKPQNATFRREDLPVLEKLEFYLWLLQSADAIRASIAGLYKIEAILFSFLRKHDCEWFVFSLTDVKW